MKFYSIFPTFIRMSTHKISLKVYLVSDETTLQEFSYSYNPLSQQDVDAVAAAAAGVVCKMEQVGKEVKAALGVKMNAPAEFKPHLMAAIHRVQTASWNVSTTSSGTSAAASTTPA